MINVDTTSMSLGQIEQFCAEYFRVEMDIERIVLDRAPTKSGSYTTIIQTKSGDIYALCTTTAQSLIAADVRVIMTRMNMRVESFFPPSGDKAYFQRFAENAFRMIFPGRKITPDTDLSYYKSLAPYSPALVKAHPERYVPRNVLRDTIQLANEECEAGLLYETV